MIHKGTVRGHLSAVNISFNAAAASKGMHTLYSNYVPDC